MNITFPILFLFYKKIIQNIYDGHYINCSYCNTGDNFYFADYR